MEFDKSRVFSAVNADELKIGSKVYVSDNMHYLRECVEDNFESCILTRVMSEKEAKRFCIDDKSNEKWQLAYLIEPPAGPKYKPFENLKQLIVATEKHGETVKSIAGQKESTIIGMTLNNRVIIDKSFSQSFGQPYGDKVSCTTEELLDNFVFLSDNSPCGELMEG